MYAYSLTMTYNSKTVEIVDKFLLVGLSVGTIGTAFVLPGSIIAFGPLVDKYLTGYDKRQKQREYQRIVAYMKKQKLLKLNPRDGNGLVLTEKGLKRAKKAILTYKEIDTSQPWDNKWRIVLFDIPEHYRTKRDKFTRGLKVLGLYQLQKSTWLHPYPCRSEISALAVDIAVDSYITFLEVDKIDYHQKLETKFKSIL